MAREKAEKQARGVSLGLRITPNLRAALETEAARTERTMSQVAVLWMEQGRTEGSPGVAAALGRLAAFADRVKAAVGDPESSVEARYALVAGWEAILPALELEIPDSPDLVQWRMARTHVILACRRICEAVSKWPEDYDLAADPVAVALAEQLPVQPPNALARFAAGNQLFAQHSMSLLQWISDATDYRGLDAVGLLEAMQAQTAKAMVAGATLQEELTFLSEGLAKYVPAHEALVTSRAIASKKGAELALAEMEERRASRPRTPLPGR